MKLIKVVTIPHKEPFTDKEFFNATKEYQDNTGEHLSFAMSSMIIDAFHSGNDIYKLEQEFEKEVPIIFEFKEITE